MKAKFRKGQVVMVKAHPHRRASISYPMLVREVFLPGTPDYCRSWRLGDAYWNEDVPVYISSLGDRFEEYDLRRMTKRERGE